MGHVQYMHTRIISRSAVEKTHKRILPERTAVAGQGMKLIDGVFSLSRTIRYCSIINEEGEVVEGGMRKGMEALEPVEEDHKLMTQLAILMGADKDWDLYLGETSYFLIHKSKVNLLLFPIKGMRGVLVSTTPTISLKKISEIRKTIDDHMSSK